jgi:signal transduction histidine kinase
MARLVNDLLLLTRSGRPDFLTLEAMDVTTFTHEVHSKSQTLGLHDWSVGRVGNGRIVADRQRLTQAMMQLAANAAKHTPRGKSIELGSSVQDGTASFWVRDSGPGVPEEEREQIFKRFGRGRGSQRLEGAGLGLAIVAAIAEAHDGSVHLHSEQGRGAEFTIRVPTEGPRAHEVIEA